MNTDIRRSNRKEDFLPISVSAWDKTSGKKTAGPFSGTILDISRHGACLLMTQVLIKDYHVFYTTIAEKHYIIRLGFSFPDQLKDEILVPAMPVWISRFTHKRIHAFKMGVDFLVDPASAGMVKLHKLIARQQQERAAWWEAHK